MNNRHLPHYVYRCFDESGDLLYVGCTVSPRWRIEQHRVGSWWGDRIHSVRFLVFPDRDAALLRERVAIGEERPACNIKGRWLWWDSRSHWTEQDYRNFLTALNVGGTRGDRADALRERARAEAATRFGITDEAVSA